MISCNSFAGAIPSRFSSLVKLGTLDISHNKLAGNLNVLGSWLIFRTSSHSTSPSTNSPASCPTSWLIFRIEQRTLYLHPTQ
uniref:Leucine-rich repeat-containing N-terminal plant-type domain-containing protein n=1 Tax=Brassica campestris TaxID=3711 RepID=M4D7K8_BRACM